MLTTCKRKIVDYYIDDYDILYIHDVILSQLLQEKKNLNQFINELNSKEEEFKKSHTYNVKKDLQSSIDVLKTSIDDIKKDKINIYKCQINTLLDDYILTKKNKDLIQKHKIIDRYLEIASQYLDIHVKRIHPLKENCCIQCSTSLQDIKINNEGTIRCLNCSTDHQVILNKPSSYDAKFNFFNIDKDMENFTKALMRYEGLQDKPNKIIYDKLDVYFKSRGFPTSDVIKNMPLNERGKKDNTNRELLCTALAHIKHTEYYEDCNLIGHIYWGWKLPNLTDVKQTIFKHYTMTQKCFYRIPLDIRDRISSLGTQYRLYRHIQLVNHECYIEDFKIANDNKSLQNHHRLWKMMCELADDPEIYYID
jgi:hypothetical protein